MRKWCRESVVSVCWNYVRIQSEFGSDARQAVASSNIGHNTLEAAPMKRRNRDVFRRSEVVAMKAAFEVGNSATKPKELWDMLNNLAKDRGADRLYGMNERGFKGVQEPA